MSQRGRSRPGNSPGGRDPRRERDGAGARRPSRARPAGPAASAGRGAADDAAPDLGAASPTEKLVGGPGARRRGSRRDGDGSAPERTFLGLSTARAVVLAVVVCAVALTLAMPLRTYLTQRADADQVAAERAQLEDDVARLTREKQQNDDPAHIKAQARDRLQYVMPGETPYQVQLPGAVAPPVEKVNKPKHDGGSWYTNLWRPIAEPQPEPEPTPAGPVPPAPPAPAPAPAGSMTMPDQQGGPVR
ncbi:Septum formation initiator [Rhodococcus tukisamuensis]|uniref:Septum formation initiator n=2 Tax=Rhodococcus tukisamuensis TaxID=168276 RepID=A0A1G7APL6_9NOCA|nr:septum formation initiator family protein [Rhodococcus tukisamuensis]SDE16640.1 Septum formation initiator [Rhodococcus tukisamuensis]